MSQGDCYTLTKFADRIEMKTMFKILSISYKKGPQKKTNMATFCNMSYTRFIPHLNTIKLFTFMEVIENNPTEFIQITELGKIVLQKLKDTGKYN